MPDADLLAWADAQPRTGAFGINPAVTTEGVPAVGWYHGFLEVKQSGRRITLTESSGQYRTWTNCTNSNQWTEWKPLSTATPPQEFNLPLAEDFANGGGGSSIYWKDQFNQVHFCICVSTPQISTATGVVVATLPEGFRPSKTLVYDCASSEGVTRRSGSFNVYPNGTISYFGDILPAGALLFGSGVFVAAG